MFIVIISIPPAYFLAVLLCYGAHSNALSPVQVDPHKSLRFFKAVFSALLRGLIPAIVFAFLIVAIFPAINRTSFSFLTMLGLLVSTVQLHYLFLVQATNEKGWNVLIFGVMALIVGLVATAVFTIP